jgi:E3 ubiquitin-protein ligase DOA10
MRHFKTLGLDDIKEQCHDAAMKARNEKRARMLQRKRQESNARNAAFEETKQQARKDLERLQEQSAAENGYMPMSNNKDDFMVVPPLDDGDDDDFFQNLQEVMKDTVDNAYSDIENGNCYN